MNPTSDTSLETQRNAESGSAPGSNDPGGGQPISDIFLSPLAASTKRSAGYLSRGRGRSTSENPPTASVDSADEPTSPTTEPSATPASPPITDGSWRQPRNVREFAAQTNAVATMVLRGGIDLERARVYSGLARTVAQAMSTEVSRARFLAQEPDLSLEESDG